MAKGKITKMKITKAQLRKLIREIADQKTIDLMDENVSDQAIRDAWPQGVELDGVNIFNAVYQNDSVMSQVHAALEADGYEDSNEVYLGYDFDSTDLIMGFDAFPAYYDEYGSRDMGGESMEGVFVNIRTMGGMQPGRVVLSSPGGVYASGGVNMELERAFPGILHIRLD